MKSISAVLLIAIVFPIKANSVEFIAHRANCCNLKENSIAAITQSWQVGADAIELDLRASGDGKIMLYHDELFNGAAFSSYRLMDIIAIDKHIATLSAVLKQGVPRGYYLFDLKQGDDKFIDSLVNDIVSSGFPINKIAFQSARIETLTKIRSRLPSGTFILLDKLEKTFPWIMPPSPSKIAALLHKNHLKQVSLRERDFIDKAFVSALKAKGIRVFIWTVNEPKKAQYFIDIGVDGLITDNLARLQ